MKKIVDRKAFSRVTSCFHCHHVSHFFHCLACVNDLANVSASACLVGQLCSILHVLGSSSAHYLYVAFSCLLGLCVLCVSSCESVVQPLLKSEQLGLFSWPLGLSSAVGMLILLPLQFVALVMRQWAATKAFPTRTTWESWTVCCLCLYRFGYRDLSWK